MRNLNTRNYKIGLTVSLVIAMILFISSYVVGKSQLFLLLNGDWGRIADFIFLMFTYAGDGLMWIPVSFIILFVLKRKDVIPLVAVCLAMSTIFSRVPKNFIFPNEPRPIKAITDGSFIHTVKGVEVYSLQSFPSGHTDTAFCFYLLFCLLLNNKWWPVVGVIYA